MPEHRPARRPGSARALVDAPPQPIRSGCETPAVRRLDDCHRRRLVQSSSTVARDHVEAEERGYRVIPVNPNETDVLGERAYPTLFDVPERIDIVDVFRRSEFTPAIADAAVKVGAKALWLQSGVTNEDAAARAAAGGLTVVMDACIGVMHSMLQVSRK